MATLATDTKPKTDWRPQTKIMAAGTIGIPLATILAWAATQAGLEVPGEVQAALGALISTVVGYMMPQRRI